jgi:glycosyltransferase involved in cell wall biosynthesis
MREASSLRLTYGIVSGMRLSVIIPAYNEEKYLAATLEHITAALGSRHDSEVIVVDNESTDATREIAANHGATIVDESGHSIALVRNTGAAHATGDVVVFVDADTHVPPGLFEKIVEALSDERCVGGSVAVTYGDGMPVWTGRYVSFCVFVARYTRMRHGATQFCRSDVFARLGGYDPTIYVGEDIEFHNRLDRFAKSTGSHTAFIETPPVITSPRRFAHFGLVKTMFYTHPVTVFLAWRIRSVWKSWYENAVR